MSTYLIDHTAITVSVSDSGISMIYPNEIPEEALETALWLEIGVKLDEVFPVYEVVGESFTTAFYGIIGEVVKEEAA